MSKLCTLWRREIAAYFLSPIGYLVMVAFLFLIGGSFVTMVFAYNGQTTDSSVMQAFFGTAFYWFALLILVPIITMRLFAEEKRLGTLETLMTAPVSDTAVVVSKFLGAATFFALLWLPTLLFAWILNRFAQSPTPIDWGPVLTAYLGTMLLGCFYVSVGLLTSSLTHNQIVAAILGFAGIFVVFVVGLLSRLIPPGWVQVLVNYVSSYDHMVDFARGQIDLRYVILYVTATVFMLFCTQKIVESRKWR
jgi:ABC-2 type transport system permease protein